MQQFKEYLISLYASHGLFSANERRVNLIGEMQRLEDKNVTCLNCPGACCTSQANSMQISPIEALEILQALQVDQFNVEELYNFKKLMNQTISDFRLDVEIYTGKKKSSVLRKNYTCPFFNNGSLGCGLSRSAKPYGCLGFNPKRNNDFGKSCSSNTELLENREQSFQMQENLVNTQIRLDLNLTWIKQNIPQALLDIVNKLSKQGATH